MGWASGIVWPELTVPKGTYDFDDGMRGSAFEEAYDFHDGVGVRKLGLRF